MPRRIKPLLQGGGVLLGNIHRTVEGGHGGKRDHPSGWPMFGTVA